MEARFDFPEGIVRVTGGKGSESLLVFGSEKCALMEAGMAFAAPELVRNIKEALRDRKEKTGRDYKLDYITLSHSHYDHIGGLPLLLKEWPDAKVVAAEKTKKVFASEGARKTIKKLSDSAAALYQKDAPSGEIITLSDAELDSMRVDMVVSDGDIIDLGEKKLIVIETKGHTDCSISFMLEPEHILFTSESTGVYRGGYVSSEIVKSYSDAVEAAKKCLALRPKRLIVAHHGILPESESTSFFVGFLLAAEMQRKMVLDAFDETKDVDETVNRFVEKYWSDEYTDGQPKDAFLENAFHTVRNMLKEASRIE